MTDNKKKDNEKKDMDFMKKIINDLVELKKDATKENKDKETYYDLWKHYQERVELLKDRLWTMGTWMMAILGAILAIIIEKDMITKCWPPVEASGFLFFLAILGLVLANYSKKIIDDYIKHIRLNWWSADYLRSGPKEEKEEEKEELVNINKIAGAPILRSAANISIYLFIVIIVIGAIDLIP